MLQEKTYFDVVSVNELPEKANRYGVFYEEFPDIPESDFFDGEKFTDNTEQRKLTVSHWLKENQGILLSKEELIDLLKDAHDWAATEFSEGQTVTVKESFSQFLESKGLK